MGLQSLHGCVESFLPAIILLGTVVYLFALMFMHGVHKFVQEKSSADLVRPDIANSITNMNEHYGSVRSTLWTLMAAISGGDDWVTLQAPLEPLVIVHRGLFLVYIFVVVFGLLSILTGVFVHAAMKSSEMCRDIAIENTIQSKDKLVNDIVRAFHEADVDQSGTLTFEELQLFMSDEKVQAYLNTLGLDATVADKVFAIMDVGGVGELLVNEFVDGCLRYRGNATVADLAALEKKTDALLEATRSVQRVVVASADRATGNLPPPPTGFPATFGGTMK